MHRNRDLYHYLSDHAVAISEEWYRTIKESDPNSVYAATDPITIQTLRQHNLDFNLHLNEIFVETEKIFFPKFKKWAENVARDQDHLNTPIHYIFREFTRVRDLYFEYVKRFFHSNENGYDQSELDLCCSTILKAFDLAIYTYIEETHKYTTNQLEAQQEVINELSSPVIALNNNRALLPLVGDIDTYRAKKLMENTLKQCMEKKIHHLFIDLSGVLMIDTMVAHQLFQLLHALRLVGVQTTLSGIRPEIAQTATQLGISFNDITICSSLASALT